MSGLSVFFLVLPLPAVFCLHDAEEAIVQRKWLLGHAERLKERMSFARAIIDRMLQLKPKAFVIAALEELMVLLAVTAYVLVESPYAMWVWVSVFLAFVIHLMVHIGQAIAVRGYIPGLITTILLIPYAAYGIYSVWLAMSVAEMLLCAILGTLFMIANLRFAHYLGIKLTE